MSDADDLVAQALGGGIDRQHLAGRQRIGLAVAVGQDRRTRAAPSGGRGRSAPGRETRSVCPTAMVRSRNACPGQTHSSTPLSSRSTAWKIRSPRRVGTHALGHHPADAGDLLPDLGPGQRRHGGRVDVAMGEVPEEVPRGADAEPLELLRPALADALEELDGRVEPEGAGWTVGFAAGRDFGMVSLRHRAATRTKPRRTRQSLSCPSCELAARGPRDHADSASRCCANRSGSNG